MPSKNIVLFSPFESSLYVPLSPDALEYNNLNNILFFLLLNNNTFTLFFLIILTPLFFTYLYSDRFINSSLYIEFILPFFLFCYNLFKNTVSKKKYFVFPFVCFLFFLLLMSNLTGLIPFNFALTSHLSSTFLLGFSV